MKSCNSRGYSLVEILVAAAIIGISLVAVVAFIRKGQEMISIDKHRMVARGIVERTLEDMRFQPESYNTLPAAPVSPTTSDVIIDADITPNIHGSLVVAIGNEQATVNGKTAPYRAISATVTWTELGGKCDTVSIAKWLTNVQRE
jgi:prepilin-type N-terminal cleavage/methylation domain-containing protein